MMPTPDQSASSAATTAAVPALLEIENLTTALHLRNRTIRPVDNVSFAVKRGEVLGLVGESGCGKSTTALSIIRLLPPSARLSGKILFEGRDLTALNLNEMRKVRGKDISMVFQEPMTALDPAFTIGYQITETVRSHADVTQAEARRRAIEMLEHVGIPNAAGRLNDYPHQFSGGMRQRVMLAIALVMRPRLLIADEPTSALDVTIQAQILDLIARLKDEFDMSVILITHDLGVVYEIADQLAVMYAGEIVEIGSVQQIFTNPQHPYTQGLLACMPDLATPKEHLRVIPGRVPELTELSTGCWFAPRCGNQIARCVEAHPPLEQKEADYALRCYNPTPFQT